MRAKLGLLVTLLALFVPAVGRAQSCDLHSEPWHSVQSAWRASWDRSLSVELLERAQVVSKQAGLPRESVDMLWQSWLLRLGTQVLALAAVLLLLLSLMAIRRGGWHGPLLSLVMAGISLGLNDYVEGRDLWLSVRQADVRTTPSGAAAVVDQVAVGRIGRCEPASADPTFCLWQADSGPQGWIETRAIVPMSAKCGEY